MLPPEYLLQELKQVQGFNRSAFMKAHEDGPVPISFRLHPWKIHDPSTLPIMETIPWANNGRYLSQRPAFHLDPVWHAGGYYVQEASSMFLEQVFTQLLPSGESKKILDLCAAPGGKSTHILSLMSADDVLISNEVIQSRAAILEENVTRWGNANVIVTQNDPQDFNKLQGYFDVIVTDAPCSGSGLWRKDSDSINEWSEDHVKLCSQRQQRILADIWPALKPGGLLVYATCSYSIAENEAILDKLGNEWDGEGLALQVPDSWGIVETRSPVMQFPGYRFFPHLVKGEGFFIGVVQKSGKAEVPRIVSKKKTFQVTTAQRTILNNWLQEVDAVQLYFHQQRVYGMTSNTLDTFLEVKDFLRVRKAGVAIGEFMGRELVPEHALAVSALCGAQVSSVTVGLEDALSFLRKENISLTSASKGWHLIRYQDIALGWVKHLGNRVNNYYPKNWRLRQ